MFNAEPYGFIQYIDDCAAGADVTYLFFELNYSVKGHVNTNFLARKEIRKQKKTRILYVKNGVRVRFTDSDILKMLLSLSDSSVIQKIVDGLIEVFKVPNSDGCLSIDSKDFQVLQLPTIEYNEILTNDKDIDISFEDVYSLIGLILSKDLSSEKSKLYISKDVAFFKKTVIKYILILSYYAHLRQKSAAEFYMEKAGIKLSGSYGEDYLYGENAEGNSKLFSKCYRFDLKGIMC